MTGVESWILSYFLNSLWQIPLFFAAGWIVARALRPAGAEVEHRVWVAVLILQSLIPAFSALSWAWLRTLLAWGDARGIGETHVSVVMGRGIGLGSYRPPAGLMDAVAIAYGIAIMYFAARFVWRWRKLCAIRREAVELAATEEAPLLLAQFSKRFAVDGVSIAASSMIFGPVTMGLSQKLVLLPSSMVSSLAEVDIRTVIAHEFAHIRRNDFFKNLVYELLALPVSYHPLLRRTQERVMESREIVCDQMAAEVGGRRQYARSLLRLASLLVEGTPSRTFHAIGIFDVNALERRIMKLSHKQTEIRGVRRLAVLALCAAFGVVTCGSVLALGMNAAEVTAASSNSAPSQPISVSAHVMAGQKLSGPIPKYPEAAKKARIEGKVVVNAVIGKDGMVKEARVVSGPQALRKSSLDAVRQYKYKPFLANGHPVEVSTIINFVYSLRK